MASKGPINDYPKNVETWRDVDVDDEDDEEISVSDLEAKSAIETLKKYLRQKKTAHLI